MSVLLEVLVCLKVLMHILGAKNLLIVIALTSIFSGRSKRRRFGLLKDWDKHENEEEVVLESSTSNVSKDIINTSLAEKLAHMWDHTGTTMAEYEMNYSMMLGKGTYGEVYLAWSKTANHSVAIKEFSESKLKGVASRDMLHLIEHEIRAQRHHRLWNEHIVKLFDVYASKKKDEPVLHMVMEVIDGIDSGRELTGYLLAAHQAGGLAEDSARHIFAQIVKAVEFCHDHGIAHRDLKPSNILLTDAVKDGRKEIVVKLIDFGLSCSSNQTQTLRTGSPNYMAPEVVAEKPYNPQQADYWSLGAMLFKMFENRAPFSGSTKNDTFLAIQKGFDPQMFSDKTPLSARSLITGLLSEDPHERGKALSRSEERGWLASDAFADTILTL